MSFAWNLQRKVIHMEIQHPDGQGHILITKVTCNIKYFSDDVCMEDEDRYGGHKIEVILNVIYITFLL